LLEKNYKANLKNLGSKFQIAYGLKTAKAKEKITLTNNKDEK
jgi:hypothetical protein